MSLNYTALTALTKKKYVPQLVDNIFKSNPLLAILKKTQKTYDGGLSVIEPLIYGDNTTANPDDQVNPGFVQNYSGYDVLRYNKAIPISAAEFTPANVVATIIFSKDDELKNNGENQVLSLLESKVRIVEESLKADLVRQLYSGNNTLTPPEFSSLTELFAKDSVYGGIARTTYGWWNAYINQDSSPGTDRTLTTKLLLQTLLKISDGTDQPDIILCSPATWIAYNDLVESKVNLQSQAGKELAGLGFQTLEFMGIPVVADWSCPEQSVHEAANNGQFLFLNTKYLNLRLHKDANFKSTPFRPDDTRLATKSEILVTGSLTANNCRRFGILKDITIATL